MLFHGTWFSPLSPTIETSMMLFLRQLRFCLREIKFTLWLYHACRVSVVMESRYFSVDFFRDTAVLSRKIDSSRLKLAAPSFLLVEFGVGSRFLGFRGVSTFPGSRFFSPLSTTWFCYVAELKKSTRYRSKFKLTTTNTQISITPKINSTHRK